MIVAGAGVGGGSLVYANTLYEPLPAFYNDPQWAHITDWKDELAPYYDQAKRMLGVVENPVRTPVGRGDGEGRRPTWAWPTPSTRPRSASSSADPASRRATEVADPFFGGAGPARNTCLNCGECMSGCRHNAKNTLVKNYLYLAEQNGARVLPLTTVDPDLPAGRGRVRRTGEVHQGEDRPRPEGADRRARRAWRPPRSAPRSCCTG